MVPNDTVAETDASEAESTMLSASEAMGSTMVSTSEVPVTCAARLFNAEKRLSR